MSTTKNELRSEDLVAALTAVLPMAGTDDTLPILTCVHFSTRDGSLVLATTDRYCLGTYRLDWEGDDVDFLLAGREAKDLLAFAKKAKRVPVTLTAKGRELLVSDFERKATYPLHDGEFVKWAALMPEHTPDRLLVGFNPHILAKFAKASDPKAGTSGGSMRLSIGSPLKPARVEIGDRFIGLAMPVRLPDATPAPVKPKTGDPIEPPVEAKHVTGDGEVHETKEAAIEHANEVAAETGNIVAVEEAEPEVDAEAVAEIEAEVGTADDTVPCAKCRGFGVVRGSGPKAGDAYKTANGAATATNPVECPACQGDTVEVAV